MAEQDARSTNQAEWETLKVGAGQITKRLKVPDGWLVMVAAGFGLSLTFCPDAQHRWDAPVRKPRSGWFRRN